MTLEVDSAILQRRAKSGFTSRRQLTQFANRLSALGLNLTWFIVPSDRDQRIERGLLDVLHAEFGRSIQGVELTNTSSKEESLWIVSNEAATLSKHRSRLEQIALQALKGSGIERLVVFIEGEVLPVTDMEVLRVVKVLAPATSAQLAVALSKARPYDVHESEVSRRLDALRKRKLLLRRQDGLVAPTLRGIRALGGGVGKRSSDVQRALFLARARW